MERHDGMFKPGESGNRRGRPKGAKGKNTLPRPDRMLLNSEDKTVQMLIAMAKNEFKNLDRNEAIPANVQLQAIKEVLERVKLLRAKVAMLEDDENFDEEEEDNKVSQLFSKKSK